MLAFFSRKIFLSVLGPEFLGLTATIANILPILTMLEFGFSTASAFLLYEPLYKKDHQKVAAILTVLGRYYRKIGYLSLLIGALIVVLAPLIFKDSGVSQSTILATCSIFLLIFSFDYFFNHQQVVLLADQKKYLAQTYLNSLNFIKIIIQMILVKTTGNVFHFLVCEFIFAVFKAIVLRLLIARNYPWLNDYQPVKAQELQIALDLRNNGKQLFVHKIAELVLGKTDSILIFLLISVKMVAFYNNYVLLVNQMVQLINQTFVSATSSIGNLIASQDKNAIKRAFDEFLIVKYWISGIVVCYLFEMVAPLVTLWLGKDFVLDQTILVLMLANSYILISRQPVDLFLQGFGLYRDTWAAASEALINIIFSLILGYYLGISGILLGTLISLVAIVYVWKPYLLFSQGFSLPVRTFFSKTVSFLALALFCGIITHHILKNISFARGMYIDFMLRSVCLLSIFTLSYSLVLLILFEESKAFVTRLKTLIK